MRCQSLLVAFCLLAPISTFAQTRDHNEVIRVPNADPEMNAAIRQAQATLDDFLKVSQQRPQGTTSFQLKVRVKDGNDSEHFWVTPFRRSGAGFEGILANEPRLIRTLKNGQQIQFTREDISDWGYVKDGKPVGSFTVCVMLKRAPKEQADYYRKNYGFDCKT